MDCRTAESKVGQYINKTLSPEDMEEFLEHIANCSSCYDELETYFIVDEAIQQLDDDDEDSSLDLREMLEMDIHKSRRYLKIRKMKHIILLGSIGILSAAVIGLMIFTIIQIWEVLH